MSREAYIVGVYSTEFRKWPARSFKELTREAYLGVLADAGLADGSLLESAWFANSGMGAWGQTSIRGQVCIAPLARERLFPAHIPIINVENACATGSTAIHAAWKDVLSGQTGLSLAIGVEKLCFTGIDKRQVFEGFTAGLDNFDPQDWMEEYRGLCAAQDQVFETGPDRTLFVDACAARARWHMRRHGTTIGQIAAACSKSHWYGARNPKAQYQFEIPVKAVLADRVVSAPLTRAMCAMPGDGAAAVLLCSGEMLRSLPAGSRGRAVILQASAAAGAAFRTMGESGLASVAAAKAFRMAGIGPADVDVAEVHDGTSFCEVEQVEALGFCAAGEGGPFIDSGATGPGGRIPVNTSGGLVSKSHPVAATGLSMAGELATQLRHEAGERQVSDARVALLHNAGGAIGLDDAFCSVMILRSLT